MADCQEEQLVSLLIILEELVDITSQPNKMVNII